MSHIAPHCTDALHWLKKRGWNLAPLTSQDWCVLLAVSHCWEIWTRADDVGRCAAIDAVAALLDGCQEVVWPMARELIAHSGDWDHRHTVWPEVVARFERRLLDRGVRPQDVADRSARLEFCCDGIALVQPK